MTEEITALDIVQEAKLRRLLESIATGQARTISQACEIAGVDRSTLWRWQQRGLLASVAARLRTNLAEEIMVLLANKLPLIIEDRLRACADAKVSQRDKNDTLRTIMAVLRVLGANLPEAYPQQEDARAWLEKRKGDWPTLGDVRRAQVVAIQAQPGSQIIVEAPEEDRHDERIDLAT